MNSTETKSGETVTGDLIRLITGMEHELESFRETLEILHDKELMESIRRSEEDVKAGRVGAIKGKKDIEKLFGA